MKIPLYINSEPELYMDITKKTTVLSIKEFLNKYNPKKIQLFINDKTESKIFNTDKYDNYDLSSIWEKMTKPAIKIIVKSEEPEIEEESSLFPLTVAFQKMSLEEFAKKHFKANSAREIWGVLMFYMKNYQDDCFPQTKLTVPIVKGEKDYSALKMAWKGTIRSQKSELKAYFKLTYPDGLFDEAKKCMEDKSKRFVLFYLSLQIFDPTFETAFKDIKTKTKQFYYNRKMKLGESMRDAQSMSFILQLWAKKGARFQKVYKLLKGSDLKMPLIKVRIPEKVDKKQLQGLINKKTKEPFKPGEEFFDYFNSSSNATFSLKHYPLKIGHDDKNFLNKNEIVKWYQDFVEPIIYKGHANLLLLDNRTKELERFEPHGTKILNIYKENELDKSIEKLFKEKLGITKYYPPEHICPGIGPQSRQEQEYRKEKQNLKDIVDLKSGTCVAWTMFYGDLRLRNHDVSRDQVVKMGLDLVHDQPQALTRYIVNFMHFLKDAWKNLDDPEWVQEMLKKFQ